MQDSQTHVSNALDTQAGSGVDKVDVVGMVVVTGIAPVARQEIRMTIVLSIVSSTTITMVRSVDDIF